MEKKTIGKFISALRRANGMTQKELGEKLYVSDKTVSRWERDECTPELSLIPVIAEIFGVTSDELLRGERNNPANLQNAEEAAERNKNKSDKQFRLLLDNRMRKYKNLTFISVGATLLAVVLAFIINLVAHQALLAFLLSAACLLGSEICQIVFALNLRLTETEEDRAREIKTFNSQINTVVVRLSFINLLLFAFVLPLAVIVPASHLGLSIDTWAFYGVIYAAITLLVAYMVYAFFIRGHLIEREILCFDEG